MKIGLVTIYQVPNYGSVLQAFATQSLFEKLGVDCKIVNYKYPNEWHWQHGAQKPTGLRALVRRILPSKKVRVLDKFRNRYFKLTNRYNSLDELKLADWTDFDAFVVGSDQVWNARFVLGDSTFMLSFTPTDKPRFSLASSFALKTLPECYREKYKRELSRFQALSVREQNGVGIINNELGISDQVEIILDPTLLLSKDDWMSIVPRSRFIKNRPYILFYMWDYAFDPKPYIFEVTKHFQRKMECDVIALEGHRNAELAAGLVMDNRCTSTIEEFIDIFANADLVITSSFHGTAFALNFGIPLISIVPDSDGDDRQSNLLKSVGCADCIVKIGTDVSNINPIYNIAAEHCNLASIRESNIKWIQDNILCHT